MKISVFLYFIFPTLIFSQEIPYQLFDKANPLFNHYQSSILQTNDNSILFFWADSTDLFYTKSNLDMNEWTEPILFDTNVINIDSLQDITTIKLTRNKNGLNGRLIVIYKKERHYLKYSDDNASSWSEPMTCPQKSNPKVILGLQGEKIWEG